jgi:hypothetical protein
MGYNGFLKVRRGLEEHFNADKISYFEAGLYFRLLLMADYTTGVLHTTTNSLVQKRTSRDQVYRALERLESKGYIRSFKMRGSQGTFATMINKYQTEDGKFLNAFESSSCEELKWESSEDSPRNTGGRSEEAPRSYPQPEENKEVSLPKEEELRIRKKKEASTGETDMSLKTKITDKCVAILGTQISPQSSEWSGIASLGRQNPHFKVIEAFETWANTRRGEEVRYPLSEFLKVSSAYLGGIIDPTENDELEDLLADLYKAGSRAFTGKYMFIIRDLMKKHGRDEVLAAYNEFLDPLDDFSRARAIQNFCEGGASAVIRSRAKDKQTMDKALDVIAQLENTPVVVPEEEPFEDIQL